MQQSAMYKRTLEAAKREIKEVKETNETLLMILDREKRKSDKLAERIKDLESEILETATKYEVKKICSHSIVRNCPIVLFCFILLNTDKVLFSALKVWGIAT